MIRGNQPLKDLRGKNTAGRSSFKGKGPHAGIAGREELQEGQNDQSIASQRGTGTDEFIIHFQATGKIPNVF